MVKRERAEPGLVHTLEGVIPGRSGLVSPGWRGRVRELGEEELRAFWVEAVRYARWEIGRYRRWRGQAEPVLASGYDAEGVVQAAFERLMGREAGGVSIFYSAEEIRRELQVLIKSRVRWLHQRLETSLVVSEWDVLAPEPNGERVSIFERLPGRLPAPDEALMAREKEQLLGEFKAGVEASMGKELQGVFERSWAGQKRRETAVELGVTVERVKTLQAQVRRRLVRFGAEAPDGVAEMLEGLKNGEGN